MEVTNFGLISPLIGIIITMLGFGQPYTPHETKKEGKQRESCQYTRDRSLIMQRLEENKEMQEQFQSTLENAEHERVEKSR